MKRQKEEWEKSWTEEWDKRVKEEKKRREEERENLRKLEEVFERERKEEEEKRKREDKARREQEERERREMEEEYERKLKEMKTKYEDEARKRAEEFNKMKALIAKKMSRQRRHSMSPPPTMSGLRIWLLGEDWNDKISVGNSLLQRNEFETEASPSHLCAKTGRGQFNDHIVSVVITPNLFDRDLPEAEITQALKNCETVSAPGPHVLLLILQPGTSTDKLKDMIKIMNYWSDQTVKHTIVLLIEGAKKFSSDKISKLKSLLKENWKWHKIDKDEHITELYEKITNLNEENKRSHLTLEIYESPPEGPSKKNLMGKMAGFSSDIKSMVRSFVPGSSQSSRNETIPVLNLVQFGSSSAEKTSAVNTILGLDESSEASKLKNVSECVKRDGEICAHHVTVVEMPQLYSTSLSPKDVMDVAYSAMSLCSFNINTFLMVLNVDPLTDEDKGELDVISDIFDTTDGKFWDSLMIMFIYQGNRRDKAVTEFIHTSRDIQELLKKCGNRYYILSIDQRPNDEQYAEILQKIYSVPCYSTATCLKAQLEKRIQLEARNKEMGKEIRALTETKKKAEIESQRSSTNCVRIVLVGKTGNGKSATGNTIINRKAFKSQANFKSVTSSCQKEHGFVEERPVTVVDTPGLFDTQFTQEEVKAEILKCIGLLSPGPHVFLLVIRIGRFTEEETKTLNLIKETFGKNAGMFSIIIFTHGDLLNDQTIESCLEDTDPQLKKLIRDCGERYHVIDNTKQDQSKQVNELLEKINRMVEKNGGGCYTNEMFEEAEAAIKQEMEKILKEKEEEMEREKKRLRDKHEEEMAEIERRMNKQRELMERERNIREEELRVKEEYLQNELKRRDEQEEKEKEKRKQDEELRRAEEERKQEQWAKEWEKIEERRIRLEEEQQKRDQEYREKYERERREMEELHKEKLRKEHDEEYQKKLKEERSEWELKEKKIIEEFEQEKREREEKEKKRIEKDKKERERIEKEYENSKMDMKRQKEEWEKSWTEEWDKRVKEEKKRREEERENLRKLEEAFERERKEEEEKRKREDKARREQEERERREMEEEYERKIKEMKRKYEDDARKQAEEFNDFRQKYTKDFQALMLKHDLEMQELKQKHEKECYESEKEYSALSELSKQKQINLNDKMRGMEERHQREVDMLKKKYEDKCVLL